MEGVFFGNKIFDIEKYLSRRKDAIISKSSALTTHFIELDSIINETKFAKRFLGRSHSWFSQRLHGCLVMNKEREFKPEEYEKIAEGFRELARQLNQYADEIEKAE